MTTIHWHVVAQRIANGLKFCWITARLLLELLSMTRDITWEHRAEIRRALIAAAAAIWLAAELTYCAGRWTRQQIQVVSEMTVDLLPRQPIPAVAPITATLQAARAQLEALVRRLYPVAA